MRAAYGAQAGACGATGTQLRLPRGGLVKLRVLGVLTMAIAGAGCAPPHVTPPHPPKPPKPPIKPVPVDPPDVRVPTPHGNLGAPADDLERLGEGNPTARSVVCDAIEVENDIESIQSGELSQGQFVNKYRAKYSVAGANAAFSAYGLIRDASAGDLAAVSVDLACVA
jgi:hypothetical protein